jgi:hypothetical protein
MVMIPKESGGLEIGIVVILVTSNWGNIFSPAIKWSSRRRAMQVHRVLAISVIHEADNRLSAFWYDNRRAGGDAVIAHQSSRLQASINLLGERLNFNLVVPYFFVSDRVYDFSA